MKKKPKRTKEGPIYVARPDFLIEITEDAQSGKVIGPVRWDLRKSRATAGKERKAKRR